MLATIKTIITVEVVMDRCHREEMVAVLEAVLTRTVRHLVRPRHLRKKILCSLRLLRLMVEVAEEAAVMTEAEVAITVGTISPTLHLLLLP